MRRYADWRKAGYDPDKSPCTPYELEDALDVAVEFMERSIVTADVDSIIKAVSRETRVTENEMCSRGRHREVTEARAIVSYLSYRFANVTLTSIGKRLGRGHETAIHYNKMVSGWLEDPRRNYRGARITEKLIKELDHDNEESD